MRWPYRLAATVAWPCICWGPVEFALRAHTGYWQGVDDTLLLWAMAAATVVVARWRTASAGGGNQSTRSASTTVRSE